MDSSGDVLVNRREMFEVLSARQQLEQASTRMTNALAAVTIRKTSPFRRPGVVPIDLQYAILERWGDLAAAEAGIPADTRAEDALEKLTPGDLAAAAALVVMNWIEDSARPVIDMAVPS